MLCKISHVCRKLSREVRLLFQVSAEAATGNEDTEALLSKRLYHWKAKKNLEAKLPNNVRDHVWHAYWNERNSKMRGADDVCILKNRPGCAGIAIKILFGPALQQIRFACHTNVTSVNVKRLTDLSFHPTVFFFFSNQTTHWAH